LVPFQAKNELLKSMFIDMYDKQILTFSTCKTFWSLNLVTYGMQRWNLSTNCSCCV